MAYKITQHRRGTYTEWLELDLVPADGELIVVEFENNVCKCKIGDGETSFSDLPYITDWLADDFVDKLGALYALTGVDLDKAKAEIYQKIEEELLGVNNNISKLESKVSSLSNTVESLSEDLNKVDSTVQMLVEPAVGALDIKYSEELSRITDQHEEDIADLNLTIERKAAKLTDDFNGAINSATTKFTNTLANNKAEITTEYTYKIAEAEDRVHASIDTTDQAVQLQSKAITKLQEEVTELSADVDEKIAVSEATTNASIAEIIEELKYINGAIEILQTENLNSAPATFSLRNTASTTSSDTDLTAIVEHLEDLQFKVDLLDTKTSATDTEVQTIKAELSNLTTKVTNLTTQQATNNSNLTNALSSLEAKLSKADADTNLAITNHVAEVNEELAKLSEADTLLYQIIYKIQDELIKKIESDDASLLADVDEDISNLNQSFDDLAVNLNTQLNQTKVELTNSVASAKADLNKRIDNLDKLYDNRNNSTEIALAALKATTNTGLTNLENDLEALQGEVTSNKTNIASTRLAVSQLNSALDNKVNLINSDLDALEAQVDTKLTATESRMQTKVDSIDQRIQTQEKTLSSVQKTVNNLNTTLDKKITEKVINSTSDINTSILEIREDIHQINLTLEQLDGTSGTGLNKDNLVSFVEQLSTLQYKVSSLENETTESSAEIQQLTIELSRLNTSLATVLEQQKTGDDNLAKAIDALDTRLSKADTDANAVVSESFVEVKKELSKLADDDLALYVIIYQVHDKLVNSIARLQASLQSEITTRISEVTQAIDSTNTKLDARTTDLQTAFTDGIEAAKQELVKEIDDLEARHNIKIGINSEAISDLTATVDNNNTNLTNALNAVKLDVADNKRTINTNVNAIQRVNASLDTKAAVLSSDIEMLGDRIDAQASRISGLVASALEKDINYDELIDIRVGYDGHRHDKAGDAVRAVGTEVQALKNSLSQYIGTQAINGLHYDTEGTIGLGQPYMLYLTANGEVLQDSGVQIISGAGGTGGGGSSTLKISYITKDAIKVTSPEEAVLSFLFSGVDSSGDVLSQANAQWKVDGITVARGTVNDGENTFDASAYVKENGTIKVLLIVTDDNGSVVTKTWSIQHIELTVSSNFNDKKSWPIGEDIIFTYIPEGAIKKTAVFKLNNEIIGRQTLEADVSNREVSYPIPAREHGSYLLEMYLEAEINEETVPSKSHVIKDLIWYDPEERNPVIGAAPQTIKTTQYATTDIVYTVYDPSTGTPTVDIEVDGTVVSSPIITPNKDYNNTPTDVYSYTTDKVGTHTIKIICGKTEKVITVVVDSLNINVSPVTTGLVFDFHPVGVSNSDLEKRLWSYGDNIHMTVSSDFDWTNGGYLPDDPDGPCFCIKAGSKAYIDYKLFANDAKTYGKEFKLVFKTKHVANPDAVFLSCLDNKTAQDHIGIQMGVHKANIYGQSGNLELAYSEEDVIEFEFNISKNTEAVPMVMGYEDGVPSRPMVYDNTYSFKQSNPKEITLGSPDCDLYIYRFKVYNTSLTAADILDNFIADARTSEEMLSRYNRNQIYDENNELDPDVLAQKCPWLRVYKLSAPHFTNNKSDKVADTTIQQIYKDGDPVLDNWICHNAQHSGQGTSSNNYGAAGRNLDFIMNKSGAYFELGDGSTASEITLTRKSVPVAYLNAKVNIASSNNLTNAILANRYNRFNPYRRPFVERDGIDTDFIKDTMEFHNCVIFIQETDSDLSTHREFADTNWHFYAIGNIGDSKKTDNTRATDPDDKYECCVEIMDVGLPLSDFPADTMINAMGYTIDEKTGEKIYTWAKDDNLGILYEREYNLTEDTEVNVNKVYYIDAPKKIVATAEHLVTENLENLYERLYVLTEDSAVNKDKVYYLDATGTLATKEYLQSITSPKDENLYEWRRDYQKTNDSEIVQGKVYYIEIMEKINAMAYTIEDVNDYLWAKNENLDILYEFINGEYIKTGDTEVDFSKTYYISVEERDADDNIIGINYLNAMGYTTKEVKTYTYVKNENLDKLYEATYVPTADEEINLAKTYFVDILEHDDFSEDYTYGWRYLWEDGTDAENEEVFNYCKQKWIDFYRFVTTSSDEYFKEHFEDYFVKDSALYYYLFTTRYCMVDNRAKNTFWHYSKTSDGSYKWDLCWDYDNDTSLGLNNFGKQVYRYGLEDIDKDDVGVEIFRESDSTFFCRVRDLFATELQTMYQTLESKNAWHAESFINDCDTWQNEFPEELWRLDIERKYIRTYTSSFINGAGDAQFLVNMCNGKMKYHRRQWERNQEAYMASKYQTPTSLGDSYHANFRVNRFESTDGMSVIPNYQFTLTPYSYIYLNVQYGGTKPIQVRANPNEETPVPFSGSLSADIINVGSAAAIRDFGDLSALYPYTASMQNATRVKTLTLGTATTGYSNVKFDSLDTGDNALLEEITLTNIAGYTGSLDIGELLNLKKFYAFGTNLTSILFADGGKLDYAELPAVNNITLKNLIYLSSDNLKLINDNYDNVIDLTVENCPLIDKLALLDKCKNLTRARLIGIDFGTKTYKYFQEKLFRLKGLNSNNEETDYAQIDGKVRFESITGAEYAELKSYYPDLTIDFGEMTSNVTFNYTDADGIEHEENRSLTSKDSELGNVSNFVPEQTPAWPENDAFTYEWVGWSRKQQPSKGIADSEEDYLKYLEEDALIGIAGDRVLYPVFKAVRKTYKVTFINTTAAEASSSYSVVVENIPYGSDATCPWSSVLKQDVLDPSLYVHNGWSNDEKPTGANLAIKGDTTCYAIFVYAVSDTLDFYDLYQDSYPNEFGSTISGNGYSLNEANKTIEILACRPMLGAQPAASVTVPDTLTINGIDYTIVTLAGFHNQTRLAHVELSDAITKLGTAAFKYCTNLTEIKMPQYLQSIGARCFNRCSSLSQITIPSTVSTIEAEAFRGCSKLHTINLGNDHPYIAEQNNCLINKNSKSLLFGKFVEGVNIPNDGNFVTSLQNYCFTENTYLPANLTIPSNITDIGQSAFNSCTSLKEVVFDNPETTIGATCFYGCTNLEYISLPSAIKSIYSYTFHNCNLSKVDFPATLEKLEDHAFGGLKDATVSFAEGTNLANLDIASGAYAAFVGSSNVTFNFPWTAKEHASKFGSATEAWGTINATLNFKEEA